MLRQTAVALGVLATLFQPLVGCGEKKGGLMLAVSTDMRAPKDINVVSVSIQVGPQIKYNFVGRVTPEGEVLLPATLAIVEPDDPNATIRVRVIAFKDRKPRVLRDILTTSPRNGRLALLRMPLSFVNDGSATGELPEANLPANRRLFPAAVGLQADPFNPYGAEVSSACLDPDQTTIDGECTSARVDAASLPDYTDTKVFGPTTGACYDASACATGWRKANVDLTTCTAPKDGDVANVTLVTTDTGHCNAAGRCFIPIDREDGWVDEGASVRLPRGVCKKIREGAEVGFIGASSCPVKTSSLPVCSGVSPAAPLPDPKPPVVSERVLPVDFASAVTVDAERMYYGSRDGLFRVPTGGAAAPVTPVSGTAAPWFVGVGTGGAVAFASGATFDGTSARVFELTSTAARSTPLIAPPPGALRGLLYGGMRLYSWSTDGGDGGDVYEVLNSSAIRIRSSPRDTSAVGRFGDGRFLVADGAGNLELCEHPFSVLDCTLAPRISTAPGPVDAIVVTPDDLAFVQRPEAIYKVRREVAAGTTLVADRLLETDLTGITDGSYFPRGMAALPKCVVYASPAGVDFLTTDGTTNGSLFIGPGALAPAVAGDQVYFVVRGPASGGGGIYRTKVPASCL